MKRLLMAALVLMAGCEADTKSRLEPGSDAEIYLEDSGSVPILKIEDEIPFRMVTVGTRVKIDEDSEDQTKYDRQVRVRFLGGRYDGRSGIVERYKLRRL